MMKKSTLLLLLCLALCLTSVQTAHAVLHSIGVARDSRDETLRYIEHHQYLEDGRHLVKYYNANLDVIASKELFYPYLPQHPTILQIDFLTGQVVLTSVLNGTMRMEIRDAQGSEFVEIQLADDVIVDAGFDAFIKSNWDELIVPGQQLRRFAVAGQSRLLGIRIESSAVDAKGGVQFRIVPDQWFARMLVGSIEVSYDNTRRLINYKGYSNLSSISWREKTVSIGFSHYHLDTELDLPLSQWLPPK